MTSAQIERSKMQHAAAQYLSFLLKSGITEEQLDYIDELIFWSHEIGKVDKEIERESFIRQERRR